MQVQYSLQGALFVLGLTRENAEVVKSVLRAQRHAELRTIEAQIWG